MSKKLRVIIAGIIIVVVLALIMRSQRSADVTALAAYKAELRAKGEKLTAEELGYPRPPESSQNLDQLQAGLKHIGTLDYQPGSLELMRYVGAGRVRIGWAAARPPFNNATNSPSWGEFSAELEAIAGALAEIRAATQNPPRYFFDDPTIFGNQTAKPFVALRTAGQTLMGDAMAALHAGQLERAQADLRALIQLAQFYREDLTLVSQMSRTALANLGLAVTWEALQAQGWSDENLATLQKDWEAVDLAGVFEKGLIGERAFGEAAIAHMRAGGFRQRVVLIKFNSNVGGNSPPSRLAEDYLARFVWMPPWAASWEADEMFYLRHCQESIDTLRSQRNGTPMVELNRQLKANRDAVEAALAKPMTSYRYLFSAIYVPNCIPAARACVRSETQRRLTITAIALERFRLRHGKLPAGLDALVPQLLSAVPIDPMRAKPLRYRINTDGGFTLYSVGEDGRDDGGDPKSGSVTNKFGLWEGKDAVWPAAAK